jgi:endonuclease III
MNKKDKAVFIVNTLNHLFPDPEVPLQHKDPFTLLIAVLLSAQCTDERVNKITPTLFELADTPNEMAAQKREIIEDIIRPCGLSPAKSKAIVGLSKILVEQHNGKVPASFEFLEALPGVGHKTASVVMAQAFQVPAFPVDTHIHRLAQRWGLSSGKSVEQTEKDLKKLFAPEIWNKLHLQIIYYGRKYCPARGHDPLACPICKAVSKKKAA